MRSKVSGFIVMASRRVGSFFFYLHQSCRGTRAHRCVATVYAPPPGTGLQATGRSSRSTHVTDYFRAFRAHNTPAKTRDCHRTPDPGHRWAASQCVARQRRVRTALAKRWPTAPLSELCLSLWCAREAPCHDHRCTPAREARLWALTHGIRVRRRPKQAPAPPLRRR